ncbi:diacylglycerol kinase family protein [Frondihabitans sp. 762G35]|uniref:diacylglycerol kinase family protein n=1 Tax=Frondihabitans sp. 762G35 TaxID=1446794 RepID=UPI000E7067AA|nr:diacylglycerol kinase family protein [Frondihabitans sp. 762G35]
MTTTKPQTIVVAINPSASFGRGKPVGPTVVAALTDVGHRVTALVRDSQEALVEAARDALADRPDALVVVGGDGMVGLGAALVATTGIPLGIVPSGTGNDMARALGIPHDDPRAATRLLVRALESAPRVVDAIRVTEASGRSTWVAGSVSAGFDAFVNERANRLRWPKGRARYDLALAIELLRLRQVDYVLDLDGVSRVVAGTLVTAANARTVGGGIALAPDAVVDDGLLDVLVVERLSRIGFLRLFPSVSKGRHLGDPRVTVHRARRVRIEAAGVVAFGDGERLGSLPVEVEVVPEALAVLTRS